MSEGLRLNVALSRSIDRFVLVADLNALEPTERYERQLDEMDPEFRETRETIERNLGKHARGVFNYFRRKHMVYLADPLQYEELKYVDMRPVDEFQAQQEWSNNKNSCHNCHEEGHRSADVPNQRSLLELANIASKSVTRKACAQKSHAIIVKSAATLSTIAESSAPRPVATVVNPGTSKMSATNERRESSASQFLTLELDPIPMPTSL